MIYFTADTHFCHDGIIKQCNRPFPDAKTMNNKLIHSWNSVVNKVEYFLKRRIINVFTFIR